MCTAAFGQHTLVERAWPIACNQNDEFTAMAAGRFVKNYAPRCVAVAHDHRLWVVAQPTLLWAASDVTPAGVTSVYGLATLVAPPTVDADRLAVITNNGLQVVRDGGAGQMVAASAPLAVWSTMRKIDAFSGVGGNSNLHLIAGVADTVNNRILRMVQYNAATELFSDAVEFEVPSMTFDVTIGDRDADLAPEVAVIGALGLALYGPTGAFITGYAQALGQGFVVARRDAFRNIVMLVNVSGAWFLTSFTPANVLVGHGVIPGGFTSPVRGIVVGAYDSDAHPDLIVSTEATVRRCVPGLGNGGLDVAGITSIVDSTNTPNGAPNRCPALLDDIDRSGQLDLVIASTAHSALIVKSEQAVAPPAGAIYLAAGTEDKYWAAFELEWLNQNSSMLGAKFVVPAGTVVANVRLWRLPEFDASAGAEVEAEGVANIVFNVVTQSGVPGIFTENGDTLLTVKLALNDENGGNLFGNSGGQTWSDGESFMMEIETSTSVSGSTFTSAVFTFAAEKDGESWTNLTERVVGSAGLSDGFGLRDFEDPSNQYAPLAGGAASGEVYGATGDRYIGALWPMPIPVPVKLKNLPPQQPN